MKNEEFILCIETGTDVCSVGLVKDGRLILRESVDERDHARRVAVFTEEVLASAGIAASDLSAVAVSKGPGSYTGLRIGVSFAKGLCYGLGIPLIGVGSLESLCEVAINSLPSALADGQREGSPLLIPMIDARRMEVYGQVFDAAGKALTAPEAWIVDEGSLSGWRERGSDVYIFGSGAAKCREVLPWAHYIDVQPSAAGMTRLAAEAFAAGRTEDTAYFEPFYLKDFVITTTKKKIF
jgi:tRNA threonylcarbamoyladenosine biosynthesis protein TsaB